jgi:hypothetical protein
MVPTLGSVERCFQHFFASSPEVTYVSTIRATSLSEPPEVYDVLSGSVYRLAYLFGYGRAVSKGDLELVQRYRAAWCSIPVRFELVKESERLTRKLQLDQDAKAAPQFQGLMGYKLLGPRLIIS